MENWLVQHFDSYTLQLLVLIGINIILALGLNLITGVTGQLSMGHAGFMSIGAYVSAILSLKMGSPFWLSLLVGSGTAGFFGFFVGMPALRLTGDYLAMVTIGFAEIVRVVFLNLDVAGKAIGLSGIPSHTGVVNVWTITLALILINVWVLNGPYGRALYSVREDEIAAEAVGVNTTLCKIGAFVVGSALAGLGGGLYAHFITYINPQDFGFMKSIELLNMVVLGGMGSVLGTVFGAVVLTLAPEWLRFMQEYRLLVYGALLVVLMIFRPNGLLGDVRWYDVVSRFSKRKLELEES